MPRTKQIPLTKYQREALGERVDEVLENTEDWEMDDAEWEAAIQSWIDILRSLGDAKRVKRWKDEYRTLCPNLK